MKSIDSHRRRLYAMKRFYMSGVDMDGMKDRLGITIYSLESWYFDDEVCRKKTFGTF